MQQHRAEVVVVRRSGINLILSASHRLQMSPGLGADVSLR